MTDAELMEREHRRDQRLRPHAERIYRRLGTLPSLDRLAVVDLLQELAGREIDARRAQK